MTPTQLSEIRSRLEKATPGEWLATDYTSDPVGIQGVACPDMEVFIIPPGTLVNVDDADFIAHAPADIALLLAEIDRLTAENLALQRNWVPEKYQSTEAKGKVTQ